MAQHPDSVRYPQANTKAETLELEPEEQDYEVVDEDEEFDPAALDDDDLEDEDLPAVAEEDEGDEASLEELLAQRAAARRGSDDADDEDDIMALASERDEPATIDIPPSKVTPLRDRQEFVCASCHLVKARVQLADKARGLCRDCI